MSAIEIEADKQDRESERVDSRLEREVALLVRRLLSDDWRQSLAAQRVLLVTYFPWLERRAVHRARGAGSSWAAIARVMQRTRQAVRQRFAEPAGVTVGDLLPPTLPATSAEAHTAELEAVLHEIRRRREADDAAATGSLFPW